jgi:hypothetical protein
MTRTHTFFALLSLTTALIAVTPAQAAFEFIAPAKAPVAAAAPVVKPLPAPVKAPAIVPVTKIATPEEQVTTAKAQPLTPVWTAKAPTPAPVNVVPAAIPLTPIVSANDTSLQVLDGPLLPGFDDAKPAPAPIAMPAPAVVPAPLKNDMISWDKPSAKPVPLMPDLDDTAMKIAAPLKAPSPIIETVLETPAPATMAPADDKVIEGFGSGIPLAIALRQVVPPQYRYSFGPGVDAGQRVSWQGGKPWSQVVADMAAKQGMQTEIAGNVVAIRRSGGMAATTPSFSGSVMEDVVLGDSTAVMPPAPAKPAARTVISTTTETKSTAFKPLPMMDAPAAPKEEAPVSLLAKASADEPMPVINRSIDISKPVEPPAAKALPPIIEETHVMAPSEALPLPEMMDAPVAMKKDDVKITGDLATTQEWVGQSGKTLRSILQEWAKQANVSLVWSSDFDYPLQTDIRIQGTFPDAVRTLLAGFSKAQPKPLGRLHKNNNLGAQPVLIIETPRLING